MADIHDLFFRWELLTASLVALSAMLGTSRQQIAECSVAMEEVQKWFQDVEKKVRMELQPQATLQEKQEQLNLCKVSVADAM